VLAVLLAPGDFQSYPRTALVTGAGRAEAPAWTEPCWASAPYTDQERCEHVSGRVVWVQKHDPDGDGDRSSSRLACLSRACRGSAPTWTRWAG
jgi:hypothetical protein